MRGNKLRGHLDALVLGVLADGPAHGYEVIVRLRNRSEGAFDLAEGTVYPVLHRLYDDGLLLTDQVEVQGRRRTVYRLSNSGQRDLAKQRAEWLQFSSMVTKVLGTPAVEALA